MVMGEEIQLCNKGLESVMVKRVIYINGRVQGCTEGE